MRCNLDSKNKLQTGEKAIKRKSLSAMNRNERKLLLEFEIAEKNIDTSPELKPPDNEFEMIVGKIQERGILPDRQERKRVSLFRKLYKPILVVALTIITALGMGIGVSGERYYKYVKSNGIGEGNNTVWNNAPDLSIDITSGLESAYETISREEGIDVIQLGYVPEGMVFDKAVITDGYSRIEFIYKEKRVYFIQENRTAENTFGVNSDRSGDHSIVNAALNQEIPVSKNRIANDSIEYNADFSIESTHYYFAGIMNEKDFNKIVKEFYFFN